MLYMYSVASTIEPRKFEELKSISIAIISDSGATPLCVPVASPFPEPVPATVVPCPVLSM